MVFMAQGLGGPIRANRFADSRESPDSRESSRGSRTEPLSCESRFGGLKIANRSFEAVRANRWHVMKIGVFLRIDSCGSIHANRPDSRCESPGHLSARVFWGIWQTGRVNMRAFHLSVPQELKAINRQLEESTRVRSVLKSLWELFPDQDQVRPSSLASLELPFINLDAQIAGDSKLNLLL